MPTTIAVGEIREHADLPRMPGLAAHQVLECLPDVRQFAGLLAAGQRVARALGTSVPVTLCVAAEYPRADLFTLWAEGL